MGLPSWLRLRRRCQPLNTDSVSERELQTKSASEVGHSLSVDGAHSPSSTGLDCSSCSLTLFTSWPFPHTAATYDITSLLASGTHTNTHTDKNIRVKPFARHDWGTSATCPKNSPYLIPPRHPSRQGGDHSLVWGTENPFSSARRWTILHHVIIIQMIDFAWNREDVLKKHGRRRRSTSRVRTEADLTDSERVLRVKCVFRSNFLDENVTRGSEGILCPSETSDMPRRMTAGIRIISPVQRRWQWPRNWWCEWCAKEGWKWARQWLAGTDCRWACHTNNSQTPSCIKPRWRMAERDQESVLCWVTRCALLDLFYLSGWQNKLPESSLSDCRNMLCLLCTMLASDDKIKLVTATARRSTRKPPAQTRMSMTHIDGGRHVFDGLISLQSLGGQWD